MYIYNIKGLYGDNGKENGNYYSYIGAFLPTLPWCAHCTIPHPRYHSNRDRILGPYEGPPSLGGSPTWQLHASADAQIELRVLFYKLHHRVTIALLWRFLALQLSQLSCAMGLTGSSLTCSQVLAAVDMSVSLPAALGTRLLLGHGTSAHSPLLHTSSQALGLLALSMHFSAFRPIET